MICNFMVLATSIRNSKVVPKTHPFSGVFALSSSHSYHSTSAILNMEVVQKYLQQFLTECEDMQKNVNK